MFLFRRLRRGALFGATVVGTAVLGLAVAGPASATVAAPANNTIIGSGSNTAYATLSALANLFNESQGCNLVVPSGTTQPLNYSCPSGGSLPAGNPPFGYGDPSVGSSYSENPFNDVVEVEPSLNSSAGITQLENQGSHTTSTAPVDFASSARGPNLGAGGKYDDQGLNFVAYAADGVDYVIYKQVSGAATAASTISGLSQAQLQGIWSGTDKCWSDVGATGPNANDLINPYSTVTTSAVTSTWDAFLSPDNSETYVDGQTTWPPATLPKCANGATAIYTGPHFTNYAQSHTIIQNELGSVLNNKDQAYAITFMSFGRYEQQKSSKPFKKTKLGSIGTPPVAPTETTILNGTYPVPQNLYNVYSDGTNSDIPVSSNATLNFASEVGFLCKPNTVSGGTTGAQITDPVTGLTYRSEIESAILAQGFFPLDGLDENVPFQEGTPTTPADAIPTFATTSDPYYQYDTPPVSGGQEEGYCNVVTTDGNTGHQ